MKRFSLILIFSLIPLPFSPTASLAAEVVVKNCVNQKNGSARLVADKVNNCRKNEKLVRIAIPQVAVEPNVILSGEKPPVDFQDGRDGDLYLDISAI